MHALPGISLILLCQLAGETFVQLLELPIPGPVVGMLIMLAGLVWHGAVPHSLRLVADTLLRYLALLFVPAGVGLMVHFDLIGRDWLAIGLALLISTGLAIAVTLLLFNLLLKSNNSAEGERRGG
ncbi:CidA/LrgA family protein [Methylonatrum kenyense]|uniref:CidA/LrgA family protein n=1 Tax=Methylonatrum kenyense TaxID=455253 RepID=UPI0020BD72D9|nr:CidA/LrgA family protein [Methylonatrum kenyense]MCK8516149.1 CidA/LrgA family protein [Methylonatrum kenyense]